MSGGEACKERAAHRPTWRVTVRNANYSAFNGYHKTASAYSDIQCGTCGACWRSKAAFVDGLPDGPFVDITPHEYASQTRRDSPEKTG